MATTWLTPGRLLLLFCAMNMLVYIDRGAPQAYCSLRLLQSEQTGRHSEFGHSWCDLYTGVIASNGVNGDKASQQGLPAYGIVVCSSLLAAMYAAHFCYHYASSANAGRIWP